MLINKGKYQKEVLMNGACIVLHRTLLAPADSKSEALLVQLTNGDKGVYPLDEHLGIAGTPFKATYKMVCDIALESIRARSYEEAAEQLKTRNHFDISPAQAKRITDYVGALVFDDDAAQAQQALAIERITDKRVRKNETLYIQFDGSFYLERIEDGPGSNWKECKIAVAFKASDLREWGNETTEVLHRDIVGFIGSKEDFKGYLLSLAIRNRVDECKNVVIITDGATYILPLIQELFPGRTYILDMFHAKENGGKYANAVMRGKNQKKEFADQICALIDEGDPEKLLELLKPYKNRKHEGAINFYDYVERLQSCMYYKKYREAGFLVGSGHIESCHRYTVQDRMKRPGQQWNRKTGQGVLSLKARYESNKWHEVVELVRIDYEKHRNQKLQLIIEPTS